MEDVDRIKDLIRPTMVVQRYLGQPDKSNSLGLWYKSPFRNERTASFLVSDKKGIHDFGTSRHYDIISFTQELFRIDFKNSLDKLSYDFGIVDYSTSSQELKVYQIKKRQEEIMLRRNLNSWFLQIYKKICDRLRDEKKIALHVKADAKAITYRKISNLEYLSELFIEANEEDKYELYKSRKDIQKYLED